MLFKVIRYKLVATVAEIEAETWQDAVWQGSGEVDFKRVEDEEGKVYLDENPQVKLNQMKKDLSNLAGKWWADQLLRED